MKKNDNVRSDNTYLVSKDPKNNPKLVAKIHRDGKTESLYLDYYLGYAMVYDEKQDKNVPRKIRKREKILGLALIHSPRTPEERLRNKEVLEQADKIRRGRQNELEAGQINYSHLSKKKTNFFVFFDDYINKYTKKDKRMVELALNRFKDFLCTSNSYKVFSESGKILPGQITHDMMLEFVDYLQSRGVGEGPKGIFERFKKVVKFGVEHKVFDNDPCHGISIKIDTGQLRKDILSFEEIQQLVATHYEHENKDVRRAFIFCLYAGLRFCDVKDLTFANVDFPNRLLRFEQSKTKGHSANSGVDIPLNEIHLKLIGLPTEPGNRSEIIFPLPSYESCAKSLERWVKRAGIDKHITWHCARHSFAVNILNNGANIKTVSSLLGHSGLKNTEKYTRAVDSLKKQAVDSLPEIELE